MRSSLVRALLCGALALSAAGCASLTKPYDGGVKGAALHDRGKLDDPRVKHVKCLKTHHIAYTELHVNKAGAPVPVGTVDSLPAIQVGSAHVGPLIEFLASAGAAQYQQISGQSEAAEVIGAALLYPNQGTDSQLHTIETCTALGVKG